MSKVLSRKCNGRDNRPPRLTVRISLAAENGQNFSSKGAVYHSLARRREVEGRNEVADGHENHEWISTATLLMVLQPHRAQCTLSQNDPMAGFGMPQASHSQSVSLVISGIIKEMLK